MEFTGLKGSTEDRTLEGRRKPENRGLTLEDGGRLLDSSGICLEGGRGPQREKKALEGREETWKGECPVQRPDGCP